MTIENGMFGLLGPNGAGKSSLMRILVTLAKPSSGQVLVNGLDLQKNRKEIRTMLGYLPQDFRFFAKLRTYEFLDYIARLAGMNQASIRKDAIEKMLEEVGLYEARNRFANNLSGGMKRRLGIAQALIGDPQIIIVDEPTTGLDPEERIRFRNLLTRISERDAGPQFTSKASAPALIWSRAHFCITALSFSFIALPILLYIPLISSPIINIFLLLFH